MTREEALYCMKANSVLHPEVCEECPLYGDTGIDHCFEDALDEAIKALEQEPYEDAISRQAVEKITWEEPSYTDALNVLTEVREKIRQLPPVNPQQKTGHWISHYDEDSKEGWYECDRCHTERAFNTDYCPDCGAKMVEAQETETWNGIHAQITAPKGTFERIFNDANDKNDI